MSQQSNDDLARALDGLGETPQKPPPAAPARPAGKIPQIKVAQIPAKSAQPTARPAQPAARPAQPGAKPAPAAAKPAQPVARPSQPVGQPATKPVQPAAGPRPMVRAAGGTSSVPVPRAARASSPLDAPADLASALGARSPTVSKPLKKSTTSLAFARTVIPILLTLGFILLSLCVVRFTWKSIDNPANAMSPTVAYTIGAFGLILWVLAGVTMSGVAKLLKAPAVEPLLTAVPVAPAVPNRPSRAAQPD